MPYVRAEGGDLYLGFYLPAKTVIANNNLYPKKRGGDKKRREWKREGKGLRITISTP